MSCPVAGPIALSETAHGSHGCGGSGARVPTQELRPAVRISARLVAATAERLSVRDWEVLRLVARFRVMSGAQLRELHWPEGTPQTRARLARRSLGRLAGLEVLAPLHRRVGGVRAGSSGLVFAVGRVGQRLLAGEMRGSRRSRQPYTPGERYLTHSLAVAQLYVDLVVAARWDFAELLAFDPEPACWVEYAGPFMARRVLKPDAFARHGVREFEYSWFVEMDMGTVSLATIEGQARHYLECWRSGVVQHERGVFPRVAWIVPDKCRAAQVQDILGRLPAPAHQLFVVVVREQAIPSLTAEAGA